jgi:hypothetical protein
MINSNTQETRSIEDLVKMIDSKKLVLPEFQRDFKWPIEKSETLFDSIFQELFIGSLIISKPKFDLTCKGFDLRERGKSSRKPVPKLYKTEEFDQNGIYTLLDGQQRATAIYRALKGKDVIHLIFKDIDTLMSSKFYDADNDQILIKHDQYIEGFDSSKPKEGEFYLKICDLYTSIDYTEKKFLNEFVNPLLDDLSLDEVRKEVLRGYAVIMLKDFRSDIIKKSNLLSVQLLNMDLEMFCLYFERSNSQGLNLSFTDIITAKVYIDFKLSREISISKATLQHFDEKYVDSVVRYINFIANGEVTKKSILKDLKGIHFTENWSVVVRDINYIQQWLEENNWVFNIGKIPYRTMLLPILSFFQNLPKKEFSQANPQQLDLLKFWFYASILDNRYGGARHGSTNVVLKKDCEIMKDLANKVYPDKLYWQNLRIEFSYDELLKMDNNTSAKALGISFFLWSKNQFKNLENHAKVSVSSQIDVHHLIPDNYIKKQFGKESEEYDYSDSILNKVRINKISNIKIGFKSPKVYLNEIKNHCPNPDIIDCLDSHVIGDSLKLLSGGYDNNYISFLKDRYEAMNPFFNELRNASKRLNEGKDVDIWKD